MSHDEALHRKQLELLEDRRVLQHALSNLMIGLFLKNGDRCPLCGLVHPVDLGSDRCAAHEALGVLEDSVALLDERPASDTELHVVRTRIWKNGTLVLDDGDAGP